MYVLRKFASGGFLKLVEPTCSFPENVTAVVACPIRVRIKGQQPVENERTVGKGERSPRRISGLLGNSIMQTSDFEGILLGAQASDSQLPQGYSISDYPAVFTTHLMLQGGTGKTVPHPLWNPFVCHSELPAAYLGGVLTWKFTYHV